mmetsp:Transcript_29240/g.62175  ORF Transcript_29240/g.62175 Transcript_29240/m.62175 type:complete len:249 (+) Transcript_29240:95-841(+)|eukprot:CAMPEP_0172300370 /NCGR_PEP_ID=MMETSP1058-20130122/2476_1 /TAXON_ID=83371 /ORGANISM="Detonula confervacea, Strain CCMP 353" /LENGTH=248 /DNA_ID=CAMNT_0013010127 /DNA_START=79 /DNA_END=825 /DNA_ORIENTATION=+
MILPIRLALVSSLAILLSSQAASSLTMPSLAFASTSRTTTLSTKAAATTNFNTHSARDASSSSLFYQAAGTASFTTAEQQDTTTTVNNNSVASSSRSSSADTETTTISMTHINDSNYQAILQNSFQRPVLVDCYISNCGPCKLIEQSLQSILPKYSDQLVAAKWDANKKENSRQFMNLLREGKMTFRMLPTLLLFVDGKPVAKRSGMATAGQIDRFLEEHLPADSDMMMDECAYEVNLQGEKKFLCEE